PPVGMGGPSTDVHKPTAHHTEAARITNSGMMIRRLRIGITSRVLEPLLHLWTNVGRSVGAIHCTPVARNRDVVVRSEPWFRSRGEKEPAHQDLLPSLRRGSRPADERQFGRAVRPEFCNARQLVAP